MQLQLLQEELQGVAQEAEEEVLVEAQELIHQVQEEAENGKNNKEYNQGYD
jgi:hypothetical protein